MSSVCKRQTDYIDIKRGMVPRPGAQLGIFQGRGPNQQERELQTYIQESVAGKNIFGFIGRRGIAGISTISHTFKLDDEYKQIYSAKIQQTFSEICPREGALSYF